jgi:hypothetical protein
VATTVASLRILLGLDSKDVKDGAGSVKSELKGIQSEAKKTQGALDDMKRGAAQGLGIGVGIGGFQAASQAVSALTGFLTDAVKAAQQDEQSVAQLSASLKANVPLWNGATDAIDKQTAAAQRLGFTDDDVRGSLQRLVPVTHDINEALKIQQTAMDLARFKNVDLATATDALVQVEAGRYRGLAALGINIKDIHNRTEALAAVQKVAAGSAEAWGNTSANAAKEAGIAFDEAQESIGRHLLPVVTELEHGMRDVVAPALVEVGNHMEEIGTIAAILGATLLTQTVIGFAQTALAAARLALTMAPLPASVTAAGASFTVAAVEADALAVGMNTAGAAAKGAVPIFGLLAVAIEGINKPAVTQFLADFNKDLPGATGKVANLKDAFAAAGDTIGHVTAVLDANADAETNNSAQLTALAAAHGVVADAAATAAASFVDFGAASIDSSAGLTAFAAASNSAADGANAAIGPLSAEEAMLNRVAFAADVAARNLAALGTAATVANQASTDALRRAGEVPGIVPGGLVGGGGPTVQPGVQNQDLLDAVKRAGELADFNKRQHDKAVADAKAAAAKAEAERKRAAAEAKRAEDELNRQRVEIANKTFDRMADAAHRYFDDLHKANLKSIDDAQKTADALIEAQKKANLEPATAAEVRLRAVQQQRQLAKLQADLAAAKTPEERLAATQALSDFQAQARIDFLHKQGEDANAILDEQKKKQDQGYADQKDAENRRNADQVNLFDENLKSLREYVGKHPAEWKKATDSVMKVLHAAGIDYEKVGAENANSYITGVKKVFSGFGPGPAAPGGKAPAAGTDRLLTNPAVAATAGLIPVGGGVKGDVYLDGNKVGEFIERYLAANASATTSGYTARHN